MASVTKILRESWGPLQRLASGGDLRCLRRGNKAFPDVTGFCIDDEGVA
jgi:hypothetical protein